MAIRLTEEEVHVACVEIAGQGERPTSLNLLDKLGRGSLTTISKYLGTWNKSADAQAIDAESLPAVVQLPLELTKDGEDLLKKMWNVAKNITDNELEIQREALKQAEIANQSKVEEAFKFSEAQSMKIERLEENLALLKDQLENEVQSHKETTSSLNNAEKVNIGLAKDKEQLQHEILELKNQIVTLEKTNKAVNKNKQDLQEKNIKEIKAKDDEIRSLEIKMGQLDEKLSSSVTLNTSLVSDLKDKSAEFSKSVVELEKVTIRHESSSKELKVLKAELKGANKVASDAEKMVAKLEGKLEVYTSMEKQKKDDKNSEE